MLVPFHRIDEDVAGGVGPGQYAGQQHPVVVAVAFLTEHDDLELLAAAPGDDFFDKPASGHAVADDYQALLSGHKGPLFLIGELGWDRQNPHGADLELRHPAYRIESRVGKAVG